MTNKPKFNISKNISYAFAGMKDVLKSEKSFKTQLAVILILGIILVITPLTTMAKLIMFISTWLILLTEAINSAIERVVDLVTQEHHELARQAKDIGAFAVLISFTIVAMIWLMILYFELT